VQIIPEEPTAEWIARILQVQRAGQPHGVRRVGGTGIAAEAAQQHRDRFPEEAHARFHAERDDPPDRLEAVLRLGDGVGWKPGSDQPEELLLLAAIDLVAAGAVALLGAVEIQEDRLDSLETIEATSRYESVRGETYAAALPRLLTSEGWQVRSAGTEAEGLDLLTPEPDCPVLDLMLSDGDGESILRRAGEAGLRTRVAVTAGEGGY
jgi:hypothetical protein